MARGIRLLLAENTANTSGHQAAFLWEKGNHNCESLAVMSAIILIKNNPPSSFPFSSSSSLRFSSLPSSLAFLPYFPRVAARTRYFRVISVFCILLRPFYVQSVDQSNVSYSDEFDFPR